MSQHAASLASGSSAVYAQTGQKRTSLSKGKPLPSEDGFASPPSSPCQQGLETSPEPRSRTATPKPIRSWDTSRRDLLTCYVNQIRDIPPFTHAKEIEAARELETLDLRTWRTLLQIPRAVEHVHAELDSEGDDDTPLGREIDALLACYRAAGAGNRVKLVSMSSRHRARIGWLSTELRATDCDKEMLDRVVACLQREVSSTHVTDVRPRFRCARRDVAAVVRLRKAADETRNRFVLGNLRLVISVAKSLQGYGMPFVDAIQEGNFGLVKAIHRFDYRRGFRFSTYAHWWIRHSIMRAIVNGASQVRLPVHVADLRRRIEKARARLSQRLGRQPSRREIADLLGKRLSDVERVVEEAPTAVVSLDERVGIADRRTYVELLYDDAAMPVDETVIEQQLGDCVRQAVETLPPVEQDVLQRRFALTTDGEQTLEDISRVHDLSRERIRQVQQQGLGNLRRVCKRQRITP